MVTLIAVLIGYLTYCIVGFLVKIVVLTAYAVGAVLCFVLKYSIKILGYGVKFLPIVGCWIFTQLFLLSLKRRVKDENAAFYTE